MDSSGERYSDVMGPATAGRLFNQTGRKEDGVKSEPPAAPSDEASSPASDQ
jgi:hypothetical protein